MREQAQPLRVICYQCGQRSWLVPGRRSVCDECGGELRQMGLFEGFVDRWFAPAEMRDSNIYRRHLQLVELLWTADGRGRELYEIIRPKKVSYTSFVHRVTSLVCRAMEEGWIVATLPAAPVPDDAAYGLKIDDPDRFVDELARLFEP